MQGFRAPANGDRILIFRRPWLDLVLSGAKTVEVRHRSLRPGQTYYLGCQSFIYGAAEIGAVVLVTSAEQWTQLAPQHRWDVPAPPYRRTCAHTLANVVRAPVPLSYWHPRGAVGVVLYR